ncbi:hypothetical protein FBFR_11230 [Flavobacterium fryxellicola]|uniref:Uncharacterized protein n=1 Tax=Flavobacterium fryxellicola TaxID=249352 RepID=A0A167WHG2_9FLAO|nr:hypothetical protein FBFR_11230 [Flavobacterium fryxellicola]
MQVNANIQKIIDFVLKNIVCKFATRCEKDNSGILLWSDSATKDTADSLTRRSKGFAQTKRI